MRIFQEIIIVEWSGILRQQMIQLTQIIAVLINEIFIHGDSRYVSHI